MKIAAIQFEPKHYDVDYNLEYVENLIKKNPIVELYVLPELFNIGYMFSNKEELSNFAEDIENNNSKTAEKLKLIAKELDCAIIGGIAEKSSDKIYNSAIFVTNDGVQYTYRKIHLFNDEKDIFDTGENFTFKEIDYKGVKLGIMICFDWIFPEIARSYALMGVQLLCHPANLVLKYCQDAMITRSIENRIFTITANRIGKEEINDKNVTFTGFSQITSPNGDILNRAENSEIVLISEINPIEAFDKFITPKNHILRDRRPEYYNL